MLPRLRALPFRPLSRFLPPRGETAEKVFVTARDGVRLCLHRVPPLDGPARGAPVMLLHGLGANRNGYLVPGRSFAHHLAAKGFDCYVAELRGAGESDLPEAPWDLDDYLDLDLPALLQGIRDVSGQSEVAWVGHSMGGVLLCCYAIRRADHGIRCGVTVGSTLDYRVGYSGFAKLFAARRIIELLPAVPMGPFSHAVAPLLGYVDNPVSRFNFHAPNVEPEMVRGWYANGFEWIPMSLLTSLATTFEEGGLRSRDGTLRYLTCAGKVDFPLLLLAGSADEQCSVEAVEDTARRIGPHARALAFGRAHGHEEDYGHCDLLVGRRAPREVWPEVTAFLQGALPARSV